VQSLYEHFLGDLGGVIIGNESSSDNFSVNKFLPTIKTIQPSLFLQNPMFIVRSKKENIDPSSTLKAQMGQAALRAIADQEYHLEFSIRLALLQSFFSLAVLKCSYRPKLIKNPRAGEMMVEADQAGVPVVQEGEPVLLMDENGIPMQEPDLIVDDETYRWTWVDSDKMLLPDAGPDHLRWPWVGEEVTVLLDDAREDERFPSNLRTQLKSNSAGPNDQSHGGFEAIDPLGDRLENSHEDQWITYVEMWDTRKRRHMVWCEGQSFSETRFLLDRDTPESVEAHPYAILPGYTPIIAPRPSPWPLPIVHSWLPLQREHNIRRKQLSNGARRTARKAYYDDSTFPDADEAVKALQSNEDMQAVKVNALDKPPIVMADPPITTNVAQDLSVLEIDWNFITGVSGARTGGRNKGADSVFEAKTQVASGEIRDLDMRHAVNVWLTVAGRKMWRLLKSTMTLGMYVRLQQTSDSHFSQYVARVYGPEVAQNIQQFPRLREQFNQQFGNDRWLEVTGEELDFDADVSVVPGSARPRNMEAEKRDFVEIIQLLGTNPMLSQSRALLARIADMYEFFDQSMIDEILGGAQKAQEIEAIKAGRMQGANPQQAALGGGANIPSFRGNFM